MSNGEEEGARASTAGEERVRHLQTQTRLSARRTLRGLHTRDAGVPLCYDVVEFK